MNKRTRWILLAVGLVAVVVLLSLATSGDSLDVSSALVARDTLRVAVVEEGQTRVRERYLVAAPVSGRLARIPLTEGDAVRVGSLIAQIYPVPESPREAGVARARLEGAEARRREAMARVDEGEARIGQLERDLARSHALARDSVISQQELEQNEVALDAARQQVAAARSAVRAAESEVAAARAMLLGANPNATEGPTVAVTAPSAGRVLRVLEESERVVPAGTPLVEIGDAEGLEVVVDVLTEDAVRIGPGAPVLIEAWGGGEALQGEVRLVEPSAFTKVSALGVEEQRVNVIVDLFDAPPSLGAGYRVEAHIVTWMEADVLTVPTSALFQQDGVWMVFVIDDGRATRRSVRIGHRAAETAEVLAGLEAGDEVILFPDDQIDEGVSVRRR